MDAKGNLHVRITDRNHPHYGDAGWLTQNVTILADGTEMAEVFLDNCSHYGTQSCFVFKGQVQAEEGY